MKFYKEFTLGKKLKRRIQELCGFNNLEREDRIKRAHEILKSTELKQAICHKILGTTFKDVEKVMDSLINERQLTPLQEEEFELRTMAPEKFAQEFDPLIEFRVNKVAADPVKRGNGYRVYTKEEVITLLAASNAPFEQPFVPERRSYPTMTREQCESLITDHYTYEAKEKAAKQERDK